MRVGIVLAEAAGSKAGSCFEVLQLFPDQSCIESRNEKSPLCFTGSTISSFHSNSISMRVPGGAAPFKGDAICNVS